MSATQQAEPQLMENAIAVLERRYLKKDEDGQAAEKPADMFQRVAHNIAQAEKNYGADQDQIEQWAQTFYDMMVNLDFLPNSPTLMNAGRQLQQLSACFVLPIEDSMESIFETVKNTALIHKSGGGTGFAFSRLRPKDDVVKSTNGVSSGPVSFMKVFDSATEAIKQGGTRRGANMAVLRVDHPDIMEFITSKEDKTQLTNFNISVGVTEEFMEAVRGSEEYDLINPRDDAVSDRLLARDVFDKIVDLAWQGGEPGVIFLDRMNKANPTPEVGQIESTNPCGEQPLLPYESCNLGSINLANFMVGAVTSGRLDYDRLGETVHNAVRFLDNVIDMNEFPLEEIKKMTEGNRKIGLGVMGFADALIHMGIPYDSHEAVEQAERIMRFIHQEARNASEVLARERGCFPHWDNSIFSANGESRPLRNATTTTIAPTGTISIIAGTSSGVEPLFAVAFTRNVLDGTKLTDVSPLFETIARDRGFYTPELIQEIADKGSVSDIAEVPEDVKRLFVTAHDVSPEWHIRIQAAFQDYTDNAVSKTVNFPNDASVEDVAEVYWLAYELGCKGVTIYRSGSREEQVLTTGEEQRKAAQRGTSLEPRPRPDTVQGVTRAVPTGCGKLYITVNSDERGPFEVFGNMGKAGGCAASQTEALARLISLALRSGIGPGHVIKQLRGISCHMPAWEPGGGRIMSCADAFAKGLERALSDSDTQLTIDFDSAEVNHLGACPECGGNLTYEGGCVTCYSCGYSQCD
ncbi:MAG: vitamin B12-dependent ribonucleotide reductase [Armatimonadota bacterium]